MANSAESDPCIASTSERTHFKIGSRKSKLAMKQSEFISDELQKKFPTFTFEIINFDTKGDRILNLALPKIGDKGLFTKELEDGLESGSIDFVVHSLKDLPCQTMPDALIISAVPEREDPSDAVVIAQRHLATKHCLDDLDETAIIGTSSLRRSSQLRVKYPKMKFETIRGNLQTRFAKLDDENNKYDAIILATAGLKRMGCFEDRISQYLTSDICFHAVSQGALAVECRRNDLFLINMLNKLNHEDTLLKCIAERTFLAKLEGGCSAPVGVNSMITSTSITLEGCALNLDGSHRIYAKFEMPFLQSTDILCPVLSNSKEDAAEEVKTSDITTSNKRLLADDDTEEAPQKRLKSIDLKHYSFIAALNIDDNKMIKAELCGLHLAEKMKEQGADILIKEVKMQVMASSL